MANNYTSLKLSYANAYTVKSKFTDESPENVIYVFVGNSMPQSNEAAIPSISETTSNEKHVWDGIFAAKLVTGYHVELVVPRVDWASGDVYQQFDDTVNQETLLTANTETNIQPMYMITDDYHVYKCISNNSGAASTIKPTGDYTSSNGFVSTSDSYVWKYLYSVSPISKFLSPDWMPAPSSVYDLEYETNEMNLLDGSVASIVVTNSGDGYVDSNINLVADYESGCTTLSLYSTDNVSTNMTISGVGIVNGTYITNVDNIYNKITISIPTILRNNTGNTVAISTRVDVVGDGNNDAKAYTVLANNQVSKIQISSIGTGYSRANAYVYGSGTGATARVILGPKYGHGYNPARELRAKHLMINTNLGKPDSTEGGVISTETSYRQYGLLGLPHKYNETIPLTRPNANTVISQTTDLTMVSGTEFTLNEIVYQGTSVENATFVGVIHAQTTNVIRLIYVKGSPTIGGILKGASSSVSRSVISYKNPEFEPYTGDILFVQNVQKIDRAQGQAEIIKFVIKV